MSDSVGLLLGDEVPNGGLQIMGPTLRIIPGSVGSVVNVFDTNYNIKTTDSMVLIQSITANRNLNLPPANSVLLGDTIIIADASGNASGVVSGVVNPAGADKIEKTLGVAYIQAAFQSIHFTSDGVSNWSLT